MPRALTRLFSLLVALMVALLVGALPTAVAARAVDEATPDADGIIEFWQAEFLPGGGVEPPAADAPWYVLELPDRWRDPARFERFDQGWYRFRLPRPDLTTPLAVMPWRVNMNAEVWLNGARLGDGGPMHEPVARNWNRPLLFQAPTNLWTAGENVIHVRVATHPHFGTMAPLLVGPDAELGAIRARREFLQITLNQAFAVLTAAVAALSLALWLRRRRDTVYLWLAGACAGFTLLPVHLFARTVPLPAETWWALVHQGTDLWMVMLVFVGHRLAGLHRPRLELALATWALGAALCYAVVDLAALIPVSNRIHPFTLLVVPYLLLTLVHAAWRQRRSDLASFAVAVAIMLGFALHDLWLGTFADADDWREAVYLAPYGAPLVFLVLAWHVTDRFSAALARVEAANRELEGRVAQARSEIERVYADRNRLAAREAANDERERIYGDLHDDLGARLLSLVYALDGHPARGDARGALSELREIVTAPPPEVDVELEPALRRWHEEAEKRLAAAQVELGWHQDVVLDGLQLPGRRLYHLTRMLREALSNVLHHADASRVDVFVRLRDGTLNLEIRDDGRGLGEHWRPGRGVTSLRQRAEEIGARYELGDAGADDANGGCRCTIELALAAA